MIATELSLTERVNRTKRELRKNKLESGHPFLCFLEHLPEDQAIYEYPNGDFEVVKITGVLTKTHFLRAATISEIEDIKNTNPAYGR